MAETLTTLKNRRSCRAYKPELIEAEQYHKGLPYYAKLNKVEVE